MTYPEVRRFLDRHVLQKMAEGGGWLDPIDMCWHLHALSNEWLPKDMVRGLVRDLTDKGYCRYQRGLWTEDGEPAGAGYGITPKGLEYYAELCGESEAA